MVVPPAPLTDPKYVTVSNRRYFYAYVHTGVLIGLHARISHAHVCARKHAVLTYIHMGNNETTPLHIDSLLGEFTKPSESQISETTTHTPAPSEIAASLSALGAYATIQTVSRSQVCPTAQMIIDH